MGPIPHLSAKEAEVLRLLIAKPEMYGLELVAASKELKPGTIYVTLQRMTDKGYVESRAVKSPHERGLPRRLFKITGLGQRAYQAYELTGQLMQEAW